MLTCRLAVLPSLARPRATSFVADPSGLSRFVVMFSFTSSTIVSLQRQPPSLACRPSCRSNVHDSSPAAVCRPSPSRTRHVCSPKRPSIRSHAATMLQERNLFVLRVECFFRLGSVYKPNIMYIQFINTLYKPHGSTNITSMTPILLISCYVSKNSPYWPSWLALHRYVSPPPLAPLKPLTLAVHQSHWRYVLHLSIW